MKTQPEQWHLRAKKTPSGIWFKNRKIQQTLNWDRDGSAELSVNETKWSFLFVLNASRYFRPRIPSGTAKVVIWTIFCANLRVGLEIPSRMPLFSVKREASPYKCSALLWFNVFEHGSHLFAVLKPHLAPHRMSRWIFNSLADGNCVNRRLLELAHCLQSRSFGRGQCLDLEHGKSLHSRMSLARRQINGTFSIISQPFLDEFQCFFNWSQEQSFHCKFVSSQSISSCNISHKLTDSKLSQWVAAIAVYKYEKADRQILSHARPVWVA